MSASLLIALHTRALGLFGVVAFGFFVAVTAYSLAGDPQCLLRRHAALYVAYLDRRLRNLFLPSRGASIAIAQLGSALLLCAVRLTTDIPYSWVLAIVIALGPTFYLARLSQRRRKRLQEQVQPFALTLANALKSTPSIGNALAVVQPLLSGPIQEEIGLVLKEVRVGSTLEQAMMNMSARVRIIELDATMSSILIGRQVGGNVPEILEGAAATLREMTRLAGVLRTKTASGRSQMVVLALAPAVVIFGLNRVNPGYFEPLSRTLVGWVITCACGCLWVAALVLARKVLAVSL